MFTFTTLKRGQTSDTRGLAVFVDVLGVHPRITRLTNAAYGGEGTELMTRSEQVVLVLGVVGYLLFVSLVGLARGGGD